jgi:hypothetical protein
MQSRLGHPICCALLAAAFLGSLLADVRPVQAAGIVLPLAQAGPAPANPGGAPLPTNVTVPGRLYVVEGIVVVLLFAGAIFAVCRSSQRT